MPCFDEAMIHRMLFCLVIPYCNIHFRFQSSQGSVAKLTTRDDQDSYLYVCHLFLNLTVKTALKSATFWRSYVQKHWWLDVRKCVKLSDEELVWLSAWSEVQIVCIWSSWCHCIPKLHHLLPDLNPDWFCFSGLKCLLRAYAAVNFHISYPVKISLGRRVPQNSKSVSQFIRQRFNHRFRRRLWRIGRRKLQTKLSSFRGRTVRSDAVFGRGRGRGPTLETETETEFWRPRLRPNPWDRVRDRILETETGAKPKLDHTRIIKYQ